MLMDIKGFNGVLVGLIVDGKVEYRMYTVNSPDDVVFTTNYVLIEDRDVVLKKFKKEEVYSVYYKNYDVYNYCGYIYENSKLSYSLYQMADSKLIDKEFVSSKIACLDSIDTVVEKYVTTTDCVDTEAIRAIEHPLSCATNIINDVESKNSLKIKQLTDSDVSTIKRMRLDGFKYREISDKIGWSNSVICRVLNGKY